MNKQNTNKGVADDYKNMYGLWEVSTEGDCEGRSIKRLGLWEGFVDTIALHLAPKAMYHLWFSLAKVNQVKEQPTTRCVDVYFDTESNLPGMDSPTRVKEVAKLLSGRNVTVEPSCYYGCVKIVNNRSEEELLKASALSKLTAAERKVLGL